MELVYPIFAMVMLTFLVGITTAYLRIHSAYAGKINPKYFRLMKNYEIPDRVAKLGRNFDNLFEVPVIFYAAGVTALALSLNGLLLVILAWLFVMFRAIHSFIHITYNHPLHRFIAFLLSFLCAVGMWVNIVIAVST